PRVTGRARPTISPERDGGEALLRPGLGRAFLRAAFCSRSPALELLRTDLRRGGHATMSLIPWPILPMPSRVLVCEWATAGLALLERSSALHREGRAMLVALVEDLARIDDVSVRALISDDLGLEAEIPDPVRVPVVRAHAERALLELAPAFDGVVLIAPETDGIHALLSRQILRAGGRVLGSTPAGIARAADKLLLARRLARFGVPALPAELLAAPSAVIERLGRDLVLKPRRGAGAEGVRRIASDD